MSKQLGPGVSCSGYGHCSRWGEMEIKFLPENSKLSTSLTLKSCPISVSLPPPHPSYSSDVPFSLWVILWVFQRKHWLLEMSKRSLSEVSYFIAVTIHLPLRRNPQNHSWKPWTSSCCRSTRLQSFCGASALMAKKSPWSAPWEGMEYFIQEFHLLGIKDLSHKPKRKKKRKLTTIQSI